MRYIILFRATAGPAEGRAADAALREALAAHRAALARAGVLLDAADLQPGAQGWRLRTSGDGRARIDGADEGRWGSVCGYLLMQARSPEEARVWSERFALPAAEGVACELEVRPLREPRHP